MQVTINKGLQIFPPIKGFMFKTVAASGEL
jgi:hypothetical protein